MKQCPYCAETIQDAAIVCKHCGRDLRTGAVGTPAGLPQASQQPATAPPPKKKIGCLGVGLLIFGGVLVFGWIGSLVNPSPSPSSRPTTSPPSRNAPGIPGSTTSPPAPALATAPAPPTKWTTSEGRSQMDDTKTVGFQLDAENEIEGWLAKQRPTLIVRCQERKTEVFVVTNMAAKPEYGEFERYTVEVRFDERPASSQMWHASTDDKALFAPNAVAFARNLSNAQRLRVRFVPFNASPQTIEFDVRGFGAHLPTLGKTCGWKS